MVNFYNFFIQCYPKNKTQATIPDVAGSYIYMYSPKRIFVSLGSFWAVWNVQFFLAIC